jgi:hypothetical protein
MREASALLAGLYGYLLTARLHQQPRHFSRGIKTLKKALPELP